MRFDLTGSIVLYNNERTELRETIQSFLSTSLHVKLYLIDNSPVDTLRDIIADDRVEYRFLNQNIGYGAAHNIVMQEVLPITRYHLVLNPDVSFDGWILEDIFNYMERHPDVGQLMPKVLYETGKLQKLCKLLPTPFDLIIRRFFKDNGYTKKRTEKYELHDFDYDSILNVPNLSGCFMFIRANVLNKVGLFDDRYFLYLEDVDLTRRIYNVAKTIFYPHVYIIHSYKKQSYYKMRLLKYHIISAIKYFNKWGWLRDKERTEINRQVLQEIEQDLAPH